MTTNGMPEVGAKAPSFSLMGTGGRRISLEDFSGRKNLVLYFYPKDDTPGCTLEACGFRDVFEHFEKHSTVVLGVSVDRLESHESFSSRLNLPYPLLSDSETEVSSRYGVYGKKQFMGREFYGIHRTTFVIDKQGIIRQVYPRVKVKEHAAKVLDFIRDEMS